MRWCHLNVSVFHRFNGETGPSMCILSGQLVKHIVKVTKQLAQKCKNTTFTKRKRKKENLKKEIQKYKKILPFNKSAKTDFGL